MIEKAKAVFFDSIDVTLVTTWITVNHIDLVELNKILETATSILLLIWGSYRLISTVLKDSDRIYNFIVWLNNYLKKKKPDSKDKTE